MIEISFAAGMTAVSCGWILSRLLVGIRRKSVSFKREALLLLFLINLLVITRITFYPMETVNGKIQPLIFDPNDWFPFRVNLIPFVNLLDYESKRELLLNLIGNSTMFIPTGILTPLLFRKTDRFWKVAFMGFLISLTIELLQLPFAVRASDVDDLILNTVGCMAGYGILQLIRLRNLKKS